jgi:hypothetical protein
VQIELMTSAECGKVACTQPAAVSYGSSSVRAGRAERERARPAAGHEYHESRRR